MHYFLDNLTPVFYSKNTEVPSGCTAPKDNADFFVPYLWGTRGANILNNARVLGNSVESPTYSSLGGFTERPRTMTNNQNISKYTQYGKGDGFALNISEDENFNQWLLCRWNEPAQSFNSGNMVVIELNNDLAPVPYNKEIASDNIIGYVVQETAKIPNNPPRYKETTIGNDKYGTIIREYL